VICNSISNFTTSGTNNYMMKLAFTNITGTSGSVTISPVAGSIYSVTGTGQHIEKAKSTEGYSGLILQSMYLNYTYTSGANTYVVTDTLIFRDRAIKYEELAIVVTR
jgi:hypothetical protein